MLALRIAELRSGSLRIADSLMPSSSCSSASGGRSSRSGGNGDGDNYGVDATVVDGKALKMLSSGRIRLRSTNYEIPTPAVLGTRAGSTSYSTDVNRKTPGTILCDKTTTIFSELKIHM